MQQLVGWAAHEFKLNKTDDNGITQRAHLEQVEKQTGRKPAPLVNPQEFPMLLSYVWSYFIELNNARSMGQSGPNPISYTEIKAWSDLTGSVVNSKDIECIKMLDKEYMKVAN